MAKKSASFAVTKTPHCFTDAGVVVFAESKEKAKEVHEKALKAAAKK